MRQIWIRKYGDPSVLSVEDAPDPQPKPGEVRVAVEATGVNFADLVARMGMYQDAPPKPFVPGYEIAGTIDAVGEGVPKERIGEPVLALVRFNGYSTSLCAPSAHVVRRPQGMDAVTGASIPVAYLTVWMITETLGRVREGDRVLVHSAGGGVGLAALDLLKWRNATAVGTASPRKHAFLRERGYDEVVDYADVGKLEPTFDLILDPIGGGSWGTSMRLLRAGGRLAAFGFSANASGDRRNVFTNIKAIASIPWTLITPPSIINENKGFMGVNMGRMWHEAERCSAWLREILVLWEKGVVRPLVHATVPFANAPEAHRILHDRENVGKVVLTP